jgi:hypothetical protein
MWHRLRGTITIDETFANTVPSENRRFFAPKQRLAPNNDSPRPSNVACVAKTTSRFGEPTARRSSEVPQRTQEWATPYRAALVTFIDQVRRGRQAATRAAACFAVSSNLLLKLRIAIARASSPAKAGRSDSMKLRTSGRMPLICSKTAIGKPAQ